MAGLTARLRRLWEKRRRSDEKGSPSNAGESSDTPAVEQSPAAEDSEAVSFVDARSRILYMRQGGRIITVLAPTADMMELLQQAIQEHRRFKDDEDAVADAEEALQWELHTVRTRAKRIIDGDAGASSKLDELERRDEQIVQELDEQHIEMLERWMSLRQKLGEMFEMMMEVFEEGDLLAPADKDSQRQLRSRVQRTRKRSTFLDHLGGFGDGAIVRENDKPDDPRRPGGRAKEKSRVRDGEAAKALESDTELLEMISEAVRNNQHMKQIERRVFDLDEEERHVAAKIRSEEAPFQQVQVSDMEADPMRLQNLKRQRKEIAAELERYQADAEAKRIMMRQDLRTLLDRSFDLLVQSGQMDQNEGLRDIDNEPLLLEQYRDLDRNVITPRPPSLQAKAKSISGKGPKAESFERPRSRLSRKGQTVRDLQETVKDFERELSEYRVVERQLLHDYVNSKREVDEARRHFDLADTRHLEEERQFQARLAAGEDVGSDTSFDLKLLLDKKRLIRNLIEAEEEFQAVKTKAVEEGVYIDDADRSSGFVSLASDGYGVSREAEEQGNINPDVFMDWMKAVPIMGCVVEKAPERPELDEWDAKSVEIWDSVSVRAKGSDHRRIDRWLRRER